jgi:hypothetical protein
MSSVLRHDQTDPLPGHLAASRQAAGTEPRRGGSHREGLHLRSGEEPLCAGEMLPDGRGPCFRPETECPMHGLEAMADLLDDE